MSSTEGMVDPAVDVPGVLPVAVTTDVVVTAGVPGLLVVVAIIFGEQAARANYPAYDAVQDAAWLLEQFPRSVSAYAHCAAHAHCQLSMPYGLAGLTRPPIPRCADTPKCVNLSFCITSSSSLFLELRPGRSL